MFSGIVNNWRADIATTPNVVWKAVNDAKIHFRTEVHPSTIRRSLVDPSSYIH
jgi:hypothetical protein